MKVARRALELQRQGVEILSFGAGEPDFDSPSVAIEAAQRALADGHTRYTPAAGSVDLREALLERYMRDYGAPWQTPAEALITVGAKAALFELALALFDDGDEVVVPTPCWVTFPEQIRFCGARPVEVPMAAADGHTLRAEPLIEALGPKTRAVVLNNPCNPTGALMSVDELRRLADACATNGVVLIADETYERLVYPPAEFAAAASLAGEYPETVVVVGSFSKTYAMTGWRIGYALGPRSIIAAATAIQSHATSNPTSFAMIGALSALREAEASVVERLEILRQRRDRIVERLAAIAGFHCPTPGGAFYAFPHVAACFRPGEGSVELAEYLLEEARVAVVPGAAFGADEHLRFSYAAPLEIIDEGVARVAAALERRAIERAAG